MKKIKRSAKRKAAVRTVKMMEERKCDNDESQTERVRKIDQEMQLMLR